MAKMIDWLAHGSTYAVETASSLVPKFYVSLVPPSGSDLAAVAAKEVADGWPPAVVDRNSARRVQKHQLFVAHNGISIGPNPLEDIAPSIGTSLSRLKAPKGIRFIPLGDGKDPDRMRAIYADWFADSGKVANFARAYLIDDGSMAIASVPFWSINMTDNSDITAQMNALCDADTNDEFLHVAVSVWLGVTVPGVTGAAPKPDTVSARAIIRFIKGDSWRGVRGLYYRPTYIQSGWVDATYANSQGWMLARVWADNGIDEYLRYRHPGAALNVVSNSTQPLTGHVGTDYIIERMEIVHCGLNPTVAVDWWGGARTLFAEKHNIWHREVYAIGNPEFVNRFSIIGPFDAGKKSASTTLCFDWDGQRLAEMSPNMKEADKAEVTKIFVSTVVTNDAASASCSLSDLYVEQLHQENGKSVADEIYKKEMVANGETLPAMTFAEAIAEAKKADTRVWHRQSISEASAFDVDVVRVTGTSDAVTVTCYDGKTAISVDKNFALMCVLFGAQLDTTGWLGGLVADPYMATWGISKFDMDNNSDKIRIQKEFDEATVYGPGAPMLSKLSGGARTAALMGQVAMSRKQFSSFVVGSAVIAANARRVLT